MSSTNTMSKFTPELRKAVVDAAVALNISHEYLVSDAGHDAKYIN